MLAYFLLPSFVREMLPPFDRAGRKRQRLERFRFGSDVAFAPREELLDGVTVAPLSRLVERLGVPVYTPLPDSAQFLMDTYGLTAEQAGDGSPDVVWLLREKKGEARPYSSGDRLPFGADVFPGHKANDTVLWVESQRAVISGDTLVDFGRGLEINERWLRPGVTREEIAGGLRPLLALPVEHVLATHGGPTDRAALERALSSS